MKLVFRISVLLIYGLTAVSFGSAPKADGISQFNKSRTKQLSKHSERYNYYEMQDGRVLEGSKQIGLDTEGVEGYGGVQNWVEIENSDIGSVGRSFGKRLNSINPFTSKQDDGPDRNLGVIVECQRAKSVKNTVIVRDATIENPLLGADVNSGVIINDCNGHAQGKKIENKVIIIDSTVGGVSGMFN